MPRKIPTGFAAAGVPDHDRSYTRQMFCAAESISMPTYLGWQKLGLGPEEYCVNGVYRVTPRAREEWHARMLKRAKSKAVQLERMRRQKAARLAAMVSVASPNHIS